MLRVNPRDKGAIRLFKHELFARSTVEPRPGVVVPYEPHENQAQIHFPDEDWDVFVGTAGQRSGKTLGASKEAETMLGIENTRGWIVAPNYDLTDRCFEMVYDSVVRKQIHGPDSVKKSSRTRDNRLIEMRWGSWLKGKSADSPNSLRGEQLDYVICDEFSEVDERIWLSYLQPRLVTRKGWALFISSPGPQNWFWSYWHRGQDASIPNWRSVRFATWDNPWVDREWLAEQKKLIPELVWRREYGGEFVSFEGLIWPDFTDQLWPKGHLYEPSDERFKVHQYDCHYRGIDIGFRHPTGCVWGAVKGGGDGFFREGDIVIYQEYMETDVVHSDHALAIRGLTRYPIVGSWISHDSARTNPKTNDPSQLLSVADVYHQHGIHTQPASTDWRAGIEVVAGYFRSTLMDHPAHPRIFVSKNCPKLIWTLKNYVYKKARSISDVADPERPRKKDDDLADALLHLVAPRPAFAPFYGEEDRFDPVKRYGYEGTSYARRRRASFEDEPGIPGMATVNY